MKEPRYRRSPEEPYLPLSQLDRCTLLEIAAGLFEVVDADECDDDHTDIDFCRRYAAQLLAERSG